MREAEFAADAGAAALVTLLTSLVVAVVVTATVLASAVVVRAADQVRVAADAAALAVLSGSALAGGQGEPDLGSGRAVARANGADLYTITDDDWPLSVSVRVRADVPGLLGVTGRSLVAVATARLDPPTMGDLLTTGPVDK